MSSMMPAHDVLQILAFLQRRGIRLWVDGGWGVDALLGEQTRDHADLDLAVEWSDAGLFSAVVEEQGFRFLPSDGPFTWVVEDGQGRRIDVHLVDTSVQVEDPNGKLVYGPRGLPYDVGAFEATGSIGGVEVPCCTAAFQVWSHTGYEIGDADVHDVMALRYRFGIPLPPLYTDGDPA